MQMDKERAIELAEQLSKELPVTDVIKFTEENTRRQITIHDSIESIFQLAFVSGAYFAMLNIDDGTTDEAEVKTEKP